MSSCRTTPRVKNERGKEIEAPLYTNIKKIVGPFMALDIFNNAISEQAKLSPSYSKLEMDNYNMPTIESLLEHTDLSEYMDNVYYGAEKAYELFGTKSISFGDSAKVMQTLDKLIEYNNNDKNFNAFLVKNADSNKYELTVVKKSKYSYDYQNNLEIFADNVKKVDRAMKSAGFSNYDIALQIARAYNVKFVKQLSSSSFDPDIILKNVRELADKNIPAYTVGKILDGSKYKENQIVGRVNTYMERISDDVYDYLVDNGLIDKNKVSKEDVYNKQSYRFMARNHMIAMCLANAFSLKDEKKNEGLRNLVERLSKDIASMLEKIDKDQLTPEDKSENTPYEEVKKDVVISFKNLLKDSASMKKISKECKNGADTLQNIIAAEMNRMQLANRMGESKQAGKIKSRIEKLTMMYEAGTFNAAFISFLNEETEEISKLYLEMVKSMNEDPLNKKTYNVRNLIRMCGYYKNCIKYFNSYMSASSSYKEELEKEIKDFYIEANRMNNKKVSYDDIDISTAKAIDEKIDRINKLITKLSEKNTSDDVFTVYNNIKALLSSYRNILENPIISNTELSKFSKTVDTVLEEAQKNALDLTADFLEKVEDEDAKKIPWGKKKGQEESIKEALKEMSNDINLYDLYLDAMADCPDKIMRLTDKAIKVAKTKIREEATDLMRQIKKEAAILNASGVKDFSWMYKRDESGRKTVNYISPKDEEFSRLVNTDAKRRFYEFFMKAKHEIDRYYPNNDGNYQIIAIRKDRLERLKNSKGIKDFGKQLWEGEKDKWMNREDEDDISGYSEMFTDIAGNEIKMQPIYYNRVSEATAEDMSEDAVSTLIAYACKGIQYHNMASLINSIELEREVLKNRRMPVTDGVLKVIDVFNKKKGKGSEDNEENVLTKIDNGQSKVYQFFDRHMDMKLYGKFKDNEPTFGKLSFSKTVDRLNQKAAVAALSLNLLNGISNVTTGASLTRIESFCGLYFSPKDLAWADYTYFKEQPSYLAEKGNRIKNSKLHLFIELFDVMQDFDNEINNVDWIKDTWFKRIINSEFMSVIQNAGEHYLNTRVALALANSIKLKDSSGKTKNLWEALDIEYLQEDGTYGTENKNLGSRLKLDGKYTDKDGNEFNLDLESIHKISRKMAGINQGIHGIYNKQDANIIQTFAIGRLLYQFRKWMPKAYDKRFANLKYNYDVADWTEGYYQTFFKFIYNLVQERNGMALEISTRWHELDERQRANCVRAMTEIGQFFLLVAANTFLFSKHTHEGFPKPEHSWSYNMLYYQMIRLQSELAALMPLSFIGSKDNMVTEFLRMFKNPMAALSPVSDCVKLTQLFMPSSYTEEIKQGQWAGHSKAFGIFFGNKFLFPFGVIPYKNASPERFIGFYLNN